MLRANRIAWFVSAVLATLLVAGCATDGLRTAAVTKQYRRAKTEKVAVRKQEPAKIDTGSIDKAPGPVMSKEDPRWQWCEQRHIDHQAGKAPGGATDLAKKLEDDRICAAVYGAANAQAASPP
jgi:hypothetical protein